MSSRHPSEEEPSTASTLQKRKLRHRQMPGLTQSHRLLEEQGLYLGDQLPGGDERQGWRQSPFPLGDKVPER
jgi:hypothetical protein